MILLDTHVVLWWQADGARLSPAAARAVAEADARLVSPITFWEIAMLVTKGRIAVDRDLSVWVGDLLLSRQVEVTPLDPGVAVAAGRLPMDGFEGDPADALLCATARSLGVPLVTKDRRLHEFAAVTTGLRALW